ncbi:hypothetical protein [Bacillus sp. AK031]
MYFYAFLLILQKGIFVFLKEYPPSLLEKYSGKSNSHVITSAQKPTILIGLVRKRGEEIDQYIEGK